MEPYSAIRASAPLRSSSLCETVPVAIPMWKSVLDELSLAFDSLFPLLHETTAKISKTERKIANAFFMILSPI